jgi:hypothetical protein
MFRQIVLALTATAAFSVAALVATTASAYPIPQPHRLSGPPGGLASAHMVCIQTWKFGPICHRTTRGGHFGTAGR